MSHSQFHCTGRVYLDLHGLIFETSICYWQDQPGSPRDAGAARPAACWGFAFGGSPAPLSKGGGSGVRGIGFGNDAGQGLRNRVFSGGSPDARAVWVRQNRTAARGRGSVVGRLGQTGLLGLATHRPAREERRDTPLRGPSRPLRRTRSCGGTHRPNTGTRPAGGGPPKAGHGFQSVRGRRGEKEPKCVCFFFLHEKWGRAGRSQAALRSPILGHKLPRVPWSHLSRSEGGEVKKAKVCIFFPSVTKRGERAARRPPCEALSSATNSHECPGATCHGRREER